MDAYARDGGADGQDDQWQMPALQTREGNKTHLGSPHHHPTSPAQNRHGSLRDHKTTAERLQEKHPYMQDASMGSYAEDLVWMIRHDPALRSAATLRAVSPSYTLRNGNEVDLVCNVALEQHDAAPSGAFNSGPDSAATGRGDMKAPAKLYTIGANTDKQIDGAVPGLLQSASPTTTQQSSHIGPVGASASNGGVAHMNDARSSATTTASPYIPAFPTNTIATPPPIPYDSHPWVIQQRIWNNQNDHCGNLHCNRHLLAPDGNGERRKCRRPGVNARYCSRCGQWAKRHNGQDPRLENFQDADGPYRGCYEWLLPDLHYLGYL